jgi:hypothetical protein
MLSRSVVSSAVLLGLAIATPALADEASDAATRARVQKRVKGIKKAAEREAKSDSPEGCAELYTETVDACVDVVTRGLDVNCKSKTIALKMSAKQAKGELFDTEKTAPPGSNLKAANAACRVHLRSLRRKRAKVDEKMAPAEPMSASCQQVGKLLREQCFPPLKTGGEMSSGCSTAVMMMSMRGYSPSMKNAAKPSPETSCANTLKVFESSRRR